MLIFIYKKVKILYTLADILENQNKFYEALIIYEKLIKQDPSDTDN